MSDADEIASEISEEIESVDNSGSFEGSYHSYTGGNIIAANKGSAYPPIPGAPPAKAEEDYSFSFEGSASGSQNYNAYSQDFEADDSILPKPSPMPPPKSAPSALVAPSHQIPSMEIQALQAELSLQHLSAEVIQLRNKQRALLKERWSKVKEKKARAEERRLQHQTELNQMNQRVVELEGTNKSLTIVNANLTAELKNAKHSIEVLEATNERALKLSEAKDEEMSGLMDKISGLTARVEDLSLSLSAQTTAAAKTKGELQSEITKRDLQLEVLSKSMEASELRMEKMRENLPAYYEQILKEKMERVATNEADIQARLDLQKLDLERRLSEIELYKRESVEELSRQRHRMEVEFSEERQHLDRVRIEHSAQESRLSLKSAEQNSMAESMLAEAKRVQAETIEATNIHRREVAEFAVRVKMLEPTLTAAEQDREAGKAIKREAQTILEQVEAREDALLQSEAGLRARERDSEKMAAEARLVYNKYFNAKAHTDSDLKVIAQQKSGILKERFRMHRCSVELSSQMDLLRQAVREVMRLKKSEAISPQQPYRITDGNDDLDDENARNRYNKDCGDETKAMHAPMIGHCKTLLRDFEDAAERMRILSEELQSDPFCMAPSNDDQSNREDPFKPNMQLTSADNNSLSLQSPPHSTREGYAVAGVVSQGENRIPTCGNRRVSYNDPKFQSFEQSGPLEVKSYVDDADASVAALRNAAAEYCNW